MLHSHFNNRSTTSGQEAAPVIPAALISIDDVAATLSCSTRHIRRMVDTQRIPQPIKLGALVRWVKADFDQWIADGCPHCRKR